MDERNYSLSVKQGSQQLPLSDQIIMPKYPSQSQPNIRKMKILEVLFFTSYSFCKKKRISSPCCNCLRTNFDDWKFVWKGWLAKTLTLREHRLFDHLTFQQLCMVKIEFKLLMQILWLLWKCDQWPRNLIFLNFVI